MFYRYWNSFNGFKTFAQAATYWLLCVFWCSELIRNILMETGTITIHNQICIKLLKDAVF